MHFANGTITATGNTNGVACTYSVITPPNNQDSQALIQLSGTFTGASVKVEVLGLDNNWYPTLGMDVGSFASTSGGTAISLTNSTNKALFVSTIGFQGVRVWASALSTGSVAVQIVTSNFSDNFLATAAVATGSNLTGVQSITATSATAFTVGQNGITNPAFQVDTSTASQATGFDVVGAAAGSGVTMKVISSGTGEAGTIQGGISASSGTGGTLNVLGGPSAGASGTGGTLALDSGAKAGGTAGIVTIADANAQMTYVNRGALKALQVGVTLTALGTTQNSSPTSAQLLGGLLSQTSSTGAGAVNLPTGTNLSAACPRTPVVGDSFDVEFYNLGGGQTLTITGTTGTTVIGTAAIGSGKMAKMKFYNSGSNTWNIYCIVSA